MATAASPAALAGGPNSSPSPTSPSPWAYHSAGFKVLWDAPVNKAFIQIFKLSD